MQKIFSISELNHTLQGLIAANLGIIKVDGEISNFVKPASGHYYFTLKDKKSQIRCVMFKSTSRYLNSTPKNGDKVVVRAMPSLYEPRGELQLVVDFIEPAGLGDLLLKLEKLKQKIRLKGWCYLDKKKALPNYPKNIAIITSATGAALQDVLNVLKRRAPSINIVIYPAVVQGAQSCTSICQAIVNMNKRNKEDVCLLVRGGGSIEDLWSFNDEAVLSAIYQSVIPIVCGIGHETDNTLAEFVSDAVAPTPSAAAEITTKHFPEITSKLKQLNTYLYKNCEQLFLYKTNRLKTNLLKLNSLCPQKNIQNNQQLCDDLSAKLITSIVRLISSKKIATLQTVRLLRHFSPLVKVYSYKSISLLSNVNKTKAVNAFIKQKRNKLDFLKDKLATLDPKATLNRGYTITQNSNGEIVSSISQVCTNTTIKTILYDGYLISNINEVKQ